MTRNNDKEAIRICFCTNIYYTVIYVQLCS